jgi:hypothetical protein
MDAHKPVEISTLEDALRADTWARTKAGEIVETLAPSTSVVH